MHPPFVNMSIFLFAGASLLVPLSSPIILAQAKSRSNSHYSARHPQAAKRRKCFQDEECRRIHPDENEGCIDKCVSQRCYDEVYDYGRAALEPGKVDLRSRNFYRTTFYRGKCLGHFERGGGSRHQRDWRNLPALKLSNISRGKTV